MIIRTIKNTDFKEWLELRYELWPYHTKEELEVEMKDIYNNIKLNQVFFAVTDDDKVSGFIELSIHQEAPGCTTSKIGFIEGWYVRPQYRRKGVGRLLVEAGEEWAKSVGCLEMASDTTEDYEISPIAHLALGYEEVDIPMFYRKKLF